MNKFTIQIAHNEQMNYYTLQGASLSDAIMNELVAGEVMFGLPADTFCGVEDVLEWLNEPQDGCVKTIISE